MHTTRVLIPLGALAGFGIGAACQYDLPNHCMNHNGDMTCVERDVGAYCDICHAQADGCTNELPPPECRWEGVASDGTASLESFDGTSTSDSSGDSPDSTADSGASDCGGCPAEAPTCIEGECVPCDEGDPDACAGRENEPICLGGTCVSCTSGEHGACNEDTERCDEDTNTCLTLCGAHATCGEAACNFYEGVCLPADAVVHVGNSQEFLSIASAAESFGPGERGTILVHSGSYADSLLISDGRVLGILAMDPGFPSWNGYDDFPQLAVTNGTVIIEGLSVSNGVSPISAVHINGTQARVWVDRSHIVNNSGGGVEVNDGAELTLKNCFVGGLQEGSEALEVNGFNTVATVVFSTIIAGLGSDGGDGTHALQCSSVVGKPLVDVRNSILLNTGGESILCDGVSVANSAVETDDYPGNKEVGGFGGGQFGWFNGIAQGDFSLTPGGAVIFVDVARWNTGDPAVDIFGTSRPNVSNTPDYAGAHLYEAQD